MQNRWRLVAAGVLTALDPEHANQHQQCRCQNPWPDGTKEQCQTGYRIGDHTAIAACAGIAGSTIIGKRCIIGGAANFAGHLTIADRTTVSGNTSIIRSITEPGQHYTGVYPSMLHGAWEKNAAILRGLDKIRQRLRLLDKSK